VIEELDLFESDRRDDDDDHDSIDDRDCLCNDIDSNDGANNLATIVMISIFIKYLCITN
jgi:hypothetical protein